MRRWIGIVFLTLVLLIVGIAGAIGWVISSETGSRWLVTQLQQWLPGELQVGAMEGRVLDAVRIEDFSYRYQDWRVEAAVLELAWQAKGWGVEIQRLQGKNLQLRLPEFADKLVIIPDLALPIPVRVHDLQLAPVTVIYADKPPVFLDSIRLEARAADTLTVSRLQVLASRFNLDADGKMDLHNPHDLAINLRWSTDLELGGNPVKLRGKGVIEGNPQHLTFTHQITHPTLVHMQGVVDNLPDVLSKVRWSLQCQWDKLQWPWQNQSTQWQSQQAHLTASGSFKDYQLTLQTQLAGKYIPPGFWTLQASGDAEQLTVQSLQGKVLQGQLQAKGQARWQSVLTAQLQVTMEQMAFTELWPDWPAAVTANGDILAEWDNQTVKVKQFAITLPDNNTVFALQGDARVMDGSPRFQGQLSWRELRWPLTDTAQFESIQGSLAMEGTLNAYKANFAGDIGGPQIPQGRWRGTATGDANGLQVETLQGDVLEGTVTAQGELNWDSALNWQMAVSGEKLNPGSRWQDWPGELALTMNSYGRWQGGGLETQVNVPAVKGQLRGYPVSLQTQFVKQKGQFQLNNLDLKSGTARLTANVRFGDRLKGDWRVAIPDLAALLPEAGGSLNGAGEIGGTFEKPIVEATLDGDRLRLQENRLRRLTARINTQKSGGIRLQGELENLRWTKNRLLTHLHLSGRGDFIDHQATIAAKTPQGDLTLQLQGGFSETAAMNWQGTVQKLTATSAALGDWALNKPTSLRVSPAAVSLASNCLQNRQEAGGAICTELNWLSKETGAVLQMDLNRVPLGLGRVFFPAAWNISGILNGNVLGRVGLDGTLRCEAALRITPGTVTVGWEGAKTTQPHRGGTLQGTVTAQGLQGDMLLRLEEQGRIEASVRMPRFTHLPVQDTQPLSGQLRMVAVPLGFLPLTPLGIEDVEGIIEAAITLDGTLTQPRLQGQANIQDGAAKVTDLGLDLKDLQVTAKTTQPNQIRLDSSLQSGEGWVDLTGDIDLASLQQWRIKADLRGEDLEIIDTSTAQLLASPDLTLTVKPGDLDIQGDLKIPDGKITPVITAFTQDAVRVSDDTVLVNSNEQQLIIEEDHAWAISAQVQLEVAPKVTLQLADFGSRLQGAITITKRPQESAVGNGELRLLDGEYRAYGQDLRVRQGVIIFAHEPIDNPSLDIRAIRRIYGDKPIVFAGIHITGQLKSPRFALFSEPALQDQSEILSYLTLGDALNLDEDNGDDPLSVGIYLLPNFYISYGINRVEDEKVYSVRYELGERLWIEGEFIEGKFNQEERGIDFSYTIEH
jgi:translocation and assembly module TamB